MILTLINHSIHLLLASLVLAGLLIRLFSIRRLSLVPSEQSRLRDFVIGSSLFRHGLSVLLLTGIGRLLLSGEKGWVYDFQHPAFHFKLTVFFILYISDWKPMCLSRLIKKHTASQGDLAPLVPKALALKTLSIFQFVGIGLVFTLASMTALNMRL